MKVPWDPWSRGELLMAWWDLNTPLRKTPEDVLDGDDENDAGDSDINNRTQRVICKAAFIAYYARNMDESVSSHDAKM